MKNIKRINNIRHFLPTKKEGQLSIFLGLSIMIIFTLLAFIVNVGLFVKAKINLQNSVDAAAYAGASVQARQLSNIAYLNWEMRNTYKEWMFKYYVLGQMSLRQINSKEYLTSGPDFDFKLSRFQDARTAPRNKTIDPYDIPSICIDFAGTHAICGIYTIPGLPRFEAVNLPDISSIHEATINSLVRTKAEACAKKTNINFATALTWAFGTGEVFSENTPLIAPDRIGAWPQALELGFRVRNLEMIVNRPPVDQPICLSGGQSGASCKSVENLSSEGGSKPFNERPIKAFMSAYRNLSGGKYKINGGDDRLSQTFTLTELSPSPVQVEPNTLSSFLMPPTDIPSIPGTGIKPTTKHYLDLKAVPVNYVSFFTNFAPLSDNSATKEYTGNDVRADGACRATKTAFPVPAYMTGFVKNPEVITYYAVKGEAKFTGLFFPFADTLGISMTAYAAAKPMGGRIGPMNFDVLRDERTVYPRAGGRQARSAAFISGVQPPAGFTPGDLVPFDENFWVRTRDDAVGGVPEANQDNLVYGIPNIFMDFDNFSDIQSQSTHSAPILLIDKNGGTTATLGMYNSKQFGFLADPASDLLQGQPGAGGSTVLDATQLNKMIEEARRPTKYEALNYLVPTLDPNISQSQGTNKIDSLTVVQPVQTRDGSGHSIYNLYGPLYGEGTMYPNVNTLVNTVTSIVKSSEASIDTFIDSLRVTAEEIIKLGQESKECIGGGGKCEAYKAAADAIYNGIPKLKVRSDSNCADFSLADKFYEFFTSESAICGEKLKPLKILMETYFNEGGGNKTIQATNQPYNNFYSATYVQPKNLDDYTRMHTGYAPGPRQGATQSGLAPHPFLPGQPVLMKRNAYSAKFVSLEKVLGSKAAFGEQFPSFVEGVEGTNPTVIPGIKTTFKNKLNVSGLIDSDAVQKTKH